jgi:putative flippase GtrA
MGATLGYVGNRQFTFADQGNVLRSSLRYGLIYGLGYLLNLCILMVFVDHLHYQHQWVQGVAICIVAVFLFIGLRFFVFHSSKTLL